MNNVELYIEYISNKKNNKRTNSNNDEIINELNRSSFNNLLKLSNSILEFKNLELNNFIKNLKHSLNNAIEIYKSDPNIDSLISKESKLKIIAQLSLLYNNLDLILKYNIKNKDVKFIDCINEIKKSVVYSHKKIKVTSVKDEAEAEDEDEDEEDNSSENESSYESETEIEEDNSKHKDTTELITYIFKNNFYDPTNEIVNYFMNLSDDEKKESLNNLKEIFNFQSKEKPIPFQIMDFPLEIGQKHNILKTYNTLLSNTSYDNKLNTWFESLMTIPFGKYIGTNLSSISKNEIKPFLSNLDNIMNDAVHGHDDAKRQIIQIMGQQIKNPNAKGNVIGLYGVPGNGKTTLIKEGIAKAMGRPFIFISLGGATDASFLEGYSYTYEGSTYGRIANGLIESKCMNPIIYFDELDKISKTYKGDEITNILIHLTDPVQNSHFRDKYFHGINIDLSKATLIFSFNNRCNVHPILLDRITTIETKYLLFNQKINIFNNYLLPNIIKDIGFNTNDIIFSKDIIKYLIETYTYEGGVRKLKSLLYHIIREINIISLIDNKIADEDLCFTIHINLKHIKFLLKNKNEIHYKYIHSNDKVGVVNGLFANSLGLGGILSIQTLWIPSNNALSLKTTGYLEKVIKESTDVACTLAWTYLNSSKKKDYLNDWKKNPMGFHIHCPDGAVPKDGPSAGAALTLSIYSLLTNRKIKNDIAMTGEINLEGKITAIGGLEEKLVGAKKAGVKLVLIPQENYKDLDLIKVRNKTLIGTNFKIIAVNNFDDVIKHALI